MDPVTAALAAGATAGLRDNASAVIKDAYAGLKAVVLRAVKATPAATTAIEQQSLDPETWQAPVAKVIAESGAAHDPHVVELAERLLALVRTENHTTVTASGTRAVAAQTISGTVHTGDVRGV